MPVGMQDANSIPWDPKKTLFPSRKNLPLLRDAPEDAAWVWGKVCQLLHAAEEDN
jgi:hypothetical protein